jgi:hypothetical protein
MTTFNSNLLYPVVTAALFFSAAQAATVVKPGSKPGTCTLASVQKYAQMRCPDSECIVAVGFSTEGAAMAEADAKRRIAEQIQSTLRTEVESQKQSVQTNGTESFTSDFWTKVVTTSDFAHAQLIRIDPNQSCEGEGGRFVVATVSREELGGQLSQECARITPGLREAQKKALTAVNLLAFAAPSGSSREDFIRYYSLATQYRVVARSELSDFREIDKDQSEIARRGKAMALGTRIEIKTYAPEGMSLFATNLRAGLNEHIGKKGILLNSDAGCKTCIVAELRVRAVLDSAYTFGPRCELMWEIQAGDSSGKQAINLGSGRISAYSTRGSMDDAISRAWKKLQEPTITIAGEKLSALLGQ